MLTSARTSFSLGLSMDDSSISNTSVRLTGVAPAQGAPLTFPSTPSRLVLSGPPCYPCQPALIKQRTGRHQEHSSLRPEHWPSSMTNARITQVWHSWDGYTPRGVAELAHTCTDLCSTLYYQQATPWHGFRAAGASGPCSYCCCSRWQPHRKDRSQPSWGRGTHAGWLEQLCRTSSAPCRIQWQTAMRRP